MSARALVPVTLLAALAWGASCKPRSDGEADTTAAAGPVADTLVRQPAVLRFAGERDSVIVPATATAGSPIEVRFVTFGGGCVQEDTTEVQVAALEADVRPYQRVPAPGSKAICTMELRLTQRTASVIFAQPGSARVRVHGLENPGGNPVVIERPVRVR